MRTSYAIAALLAAACAQTRLTPASGNTFHPEEDERSLWRQAEEVEDRFESSGLVYADAALETYLDEVAHRIQPPSAFAAIPFRIRVVKNPYLNAFTLPNGRIYVHTGMLARMDNEAQLATLLGHEMSHATHRHAVREWRDLQNHAALAVGLNSILPGIGTLAGFSGVRGYSRELETEADDEGLRLVVNAGYDAREAPKLFTHLQDQLREEKQSEPFFFGTHPALSARIENYRTRIEAQGLDRKPGATNAEAFLAHTRAVVYDNAVLDLRAGRFASAERGARKFAQLDPASARGPFLLGEIARQRSDGEWDKALDDYRRAVTLDAAYPDPYRAIGLILYKRGDKSAAKEAFEKYLSLSPTAADRGYIETYLGGSK
ncbi:MAG TPA: M48 family metallopeptidase [Myxococcales bacterium]|jgi:predicted Zn-dependent protease|nr:M48 family metallopeptidase [Myxococcales bacterium]